MSLSFFAQKPESPEIEIQRPHLDLSGPRLTQAFEALLQGTDALGGIERYVAALELKGNLFRDAFKNIKQDGLSLDTFRGVCPFISTVRRRVGPFLEEQQFPTIERAITELLEDVGNTSLTDQRLANFCAYFPRDKSHRWVKDLAGEVLHNTYPELYPLMNRWVWDRKSNTGVLREIWFADDVDNMTIDIPDDNATFLMLREELAQFLSGNGVFSDVMLYIDLLCAQVYADYICAQGGTYLRADFASPDDPMQHVRRLLGLDGVKPGTTRTRLKAIDGEAFVIEEDQPLLG